MTKLTCFKAYDIRGRIPSELNEDLAYQIGQSYAAFVKPKIVAVGRDIRASSARLSAALTRGLNDSGVNVADIGLCGTEGVYFATFAEGLDGGIMVTASHNPPDYNGMKFVREGSRPISADTGLVEMRALIEDASLPPPATKPGKSQARDISGKYVEHLLSYVRREQACVPSRWSSTPATAGLGWWLINSSRTCPLSSSRCITSRTVPFPTACRIR